MTARWLLAPDGRDLGGDVDLAEAYAYPPPERRPAGRPWVRANMVGSVDGAPSGVDGLSGSLATAADRRVFRVLRSLADVVLVGAGTARAEGYRPAALPIAVVSGRLDLDLDSPLLAAATHRTIVLTSSAAGRERVRAAAEVADVEVCGDGSVDLVQALEALRRRGLADVLCEGGPSLLGQLAAAGLLDELCLTVVPTLEGSAAAGRALGGPPLPAPLPLTLGHLLEDEGTLLTRWLVTR